MPVYQYKGLTRSRKTTRGVIDAPSIRAARLKLREDGVYPTEISEGKARSSLSELFSRLKLPELRRVSPLDLSLFTNQLATLISAGIPVN